MVALRVGAARPGLVRRSAGSGMGGGAHLGRRLPVQWPAGPCQKERGAGSGWGAHLGHWLPVQCPIGHCQLPSPLAPEALEHRGRLGVDPRRPSPPR
eukprot:14029088-Alexandrium_andersonii.AAC.1